MSHRDDDVKKVYIIRVVTKNTVFPSFAKEYEAVDDDEIKAVCELYSSIGFWTYDQSNKESLFVSPGNIQFVTFKEKA